MGLVSKLDKLKLLAPLSDSHNESKDAESSTVDESFDDVDEIDTESQSILSGIIAQLRPGCDLTKITLPTFVLEKKSMLERITNFFQIPDILIAANNSEDKLERFILMVKWYLASWHIAPKGVKKPLNPVLGEVFTCYWDDLPGASKAMYVSEQVSHHPPKSSYFYIIPELKIRADGILIPKSKFLGNSSAAIMEGVAHVTLGQRNGEVYTMNQPNVYCRGILFGKLRTELGDDMFVKCPENCLEAKIEFKTKGFISGTYDAINGHIANSKTGEHIFAISGKWNRIMYITDLRSGEKTVLFDTQAAQLVPPDVRPLDDQWDYESRKLWRSTIDALDEKDHTTATSEKSRVENDQREKAKLRISQNEPYTPRFFRPVEVDEADFAELGYVFDQEIDLAASPSLLSQLVCGSVPIFPGENYAEYPKFRDFS